MLCPLFHRNIMTVSRTPVNKHDIVSIYTTVSGSLSGQFSICKFLEISATTTQPQPTKKLKPRPDPTQPIANS